MEVKRPGVLASYRALPKENPSAATDDLILGAARAARARVPGRQATRVASGCVLMCVTVLLARWLWPVTPAVDTRTFGLAEGQVRSYLTTFDIGATNHSSPEESIP